MYKIELTTADSNEYLLKELYCKTWNETREKIKTCQENYKNIIIRVYNKDMIHLGDFTNILIIPQEKKKINYNKIIKTMFFIIFLIILFPVMILIETAKRS